MIGGNKYYINHGLISIISRVISMPLAVIFNVISLARNLSSNDYGVIGLMLQIL